MNKEIEVKLKYKNRKSVINRLKTLGAEKIEDISLIDRYYGLGHSDMSNKNNIVRIRTKNNDSELTFKGNTKNMNNVWERTELTVAIDDPEVMEQILLLSGFNKIKINKSEREIWRIGQVHIEFIDFIIPEKLQLIEIEAKDTRTVDSVVEKLGKLVSRVGEESFNKFDAKRENIKK